MIGPAYDGVGSRRLLATSLIPALLRHYAFNSTVFVLLFLPVAVAGYYALLHTTWKACRSTF